MLDEPVEALFDDTQTAALEDYRTASIQLRYNDLSDNAKNYKRCVPSMANCSSFIIIFYSNAILFFVWTLP